MTEGASLVYMLSSLLPSSIAGQMPGGDSAASYYCQCGCINRSSPKMERYLYGAGVGFLSTIRVPGRVLKLLPFVRLGAAAAEKTSR